MGSDQSPFSVFLLLSLALSVCHGSPTFEDYWNTMLPGTPMPSAVRDHLIDEPTVIPAAAERHGDDTKPVSGVVYSVNGEPVTVDFGRKPVTTYLDNTDHKKLGGHRGNQGDGAAGNNPQLSGVVYSVNGEPVTVDLGRKPISIYFDNADHNKPGGRHGTKLPLALYATSKVGAGGVPTISDLRRRDDVEPIELRHDNHGDGAAGNNPQLLGVVYSVNGEPVTVGLGRKPVSTYFDNTDHKKPGARQYGTKLPDLAPFSSRNVGTDIESTAAELTRKDDVEPVEVHRGNNGDGAAGNNPQLSGVVYSVNGEPVTVDLGRKPISIYFDNADHKKPGGRHGTNLPLAPYSSRKVGTRGAAHHDHDHNVIDSLNARNFFLEKDLHVEAKLVMVLGRGLSGDKFLHREVADSIPFSSRETTEILRRFGIRPGSPIANKMEETLRRCKEPGIADEWLFCATSFESMVDFVLSSMGTGDLETLTTTTTYAAGAGQGQVAPPDQQTYTVRSWAVMSTPDTTATACHVLKYPYTVFHCHRIPRSRIYLLKMVGEDGTAVDAAAICHTDTSKWSPTFYVLRAFGLRPGEETICHLLPDGDVTWLPRRGGRVAAGST